VPTHALWHVLTSALLGVLRPGTPAQSLYVLRVLNIVLALSSIAVFMRLVRSYADEWVTAWATLILAFSQACLRYSLSVEVYSLNNLILTIAFFATYRVATRAGSEVKAGDLVVLALLSVLAIATHLANVLLVPSVVVWVAKEDVAAVTTELETRLPDARVLALRIAEQGANAQ